MGLEMEKISMASDMAMAITIVFCKSLFRLEGIKRIEAVSDGIKGTIKTDTGKIKVDKPGKFMVTADEEGRLHIRKLTVLEIEKYSQDLKPEEREKLS